MRESPFEIFIFIIFNFLIFDLKNSKTTVPKTCEPIVIIRKQTDLEGKLSCQEHVFLTIINI